MSIHSHFVRFIICFQTESSPPVQQPRRPHPPAGAAFFIIFNKVFLRRTKMLDKRTLRCYDESIILQDKCVRAERVAQAMVPESCRRVQGNNRESGEVHSVSSVLKQQ